MHRRRGNTKCRQYALCVAFLRTDNTADHICLQRKESLSACQHQKLHYLSDRYDRAFTPSKTHSPLPSLQDPCAAYCVFAPVACPAKRPTSWINVRSSTGFAIYPDAPTLNAI